MRTLFMLPCMLPCLAALVGCSGTTSYVHSDTTLGRVVVYRNGVAYFERTATVAQKSLDLKVPADKVDDFLKSLTVVDARTGDPAPISYPTAGTPDEGGLIDMKIALTSGAPRALRVSYVTESPSWKPSYRLVVGKSGKVNLQGWAIVDNTSGEDWKNVELGVGASSALSFRFDLRSIRLVQRETLSSDNLFAQAPPMGGAAYGQLLNNAQSGGAGAGPRVVGELSDATLAQSEEAARSVRKEARATPGTTEISATKGGRSYPPSRPQAMPEAASQAGVPLPPPRQPAPSDTLAQQLRASKNQIVVEGYAAATDGDQRGASLERANRAREQLIRGGVDPSRIVAIGNGMQAGHAPGVRVVEAPPPAQAHADRDADGIPDSVDVCTPGNMDDGCPPVAAAAAARAASAEPIGTSHFESKSRMTVPRGTSAMISILNTETEGSVVYYYDAESARGNARFPFRAVRVKNPTDSALESGPVSVFGEGRFIGEGLSEPIPARSVAFVPFALDRQVVVERKEDGKDQIARILSVQRGVFSTEVQHTRKTTLELTNRLSEPAVVYVRHTVAEGYKLTKSPDKRERIGGAYLFRVELPPSGKAEITVEEATPVFRSADIRSPDGMDLVHAFLSSAAEAQLKEPVEELLKLQRSMASVEQQIATTHDQMAAYRARMDELHAQIVTLRAVRTAGPLMQSLEKKLTEVSDKLSKATMDLVALEEKLMVARVKFQDGIADLSLAPKTEVVAKRDEAPKG